MHALLFLGYCCLCAYGILKIPFVRNSGIRPAFLLLFFGLHVAAGLLHNFIAWRYYPEHGDIWYFYNFSFLARHRLTSDFALFLKDNERWTYITHNGIIWIYMFFNFLSFDNLSIDTLLFSFPVFLGNIALFRLFRRRFADSPVSAFTVFLLPSTLFWTACIHREGMLYMLLGFLLYTFNHWLTTSRPRSAIYASLCLIFIFYFRFSLLFPILPALTVWYLAENNIPRRRIVQYTGAALLLFIILALSWPGLPHVIAGRQQEFAGLEGNSRLPLPLMDGTWTSIIKVFPAALRNGFFEPLPGSGGKTVYLAFSFELLLIWLIAAAAILHRRSKPAASPAPAQSPNSSQQPNPSSFTLFCLVFTLTGLLLIGAIVPFAGAIVRYRSIFLPFLLAPSLHALKNRAIFRHINTLLSRCLLPKNGDPTQSY